MTKAVFVYKLDNEVYRLFGEYKFLEEEIKSSRFEYLVIDIKDIELFEDEDDI